MEFGITDLPLEDSEKDLLEMNKYVNGLKKFILECPTPMSIAIQGDWGTGKTSIINSLDTKLSQESNNNVRTIKFNTWQYSQFSEGDSLYCSLLTCLIEKMSNESTKNQVIEISKKLVNIIYKTGKNFVPYGDKIDDESIKELFIKNQDKAKSISDFKDDFRNMVKEYLVKEDYRLVIFIDDLDRLNPDVALELLESIKLFLDVKQCVFVLAIDYDVIVQGVRKKFGKDTSLEKCKSFFDKIIQLPFQMPVEYYNLRKLMEESLKDRVNLKHLELLSDFVKTTVGTNPRTFKRLINSFLLTQSIQKEVEIENNKNEMQLSLELLLCALCIQMSAPELYSYIISTNEWIVDKDSELFDTDLDLKQTSDELGKKLKEYAENDCDISERKIDKAIKVLEGLSKVLKELNCKKSILEKFFDVIGISNITSVAITETERARKKATIVNKIEINGIVEFDNVESVAMAITNTFDKILNQNSNMLQTCIDKVHMVSSDPEISNSVFISKKEIKVNGKSIYIGTSTGFPDKCRYTNKLCEICKLSEGYIKWFNNEEVVYVSKGVK